MIEELKTYSDSDLRNLDSLMHELSETSFCSSKILDMVMKDENVHLYVLRHSHKQGEIIASACLCVAHTTEFFLGFVEAVMVSSAYRRNGYGRFLMEHIIEEARRLGVQQLHLTSNTKRVVANGLYQSLGFEWYETNCYKMDIK